MAKGALGTKARIKRLEALLALLSSSAGASPSIIAANGQKLLKSLVGASAGDWQFLQPIDGTVDDAPRIMTALGLGPVVLLRGSAGQKFQSLTPIDLSSRQFLFGTPDATFECRQTTGSGAFNAVFRGLRPDGPFAAVLTSNAVVGDNKFFMNAAPAIGDLIGIGLGVIGASSGSPVFTVIDVSGASSPFTVTVERPILFPFASGLAVQSFLSRVEYTLIEGNGMHIDCFSGDRVIEIAAGYYCTVSGLIIDGRGVNMTGSFMCSFDVGSIGCNFERIKVGNFGSGVETAITIEFTEQCTHDDITAFQVSNGTAGVGIGMDSSIMGTITASCVTYECDFGVSLGIDGGQGNFNASIGGKHYSHGIAGIVGSALTDCTFDEVTAELNGQFGIHLIDQGGGVPNCSGIEITNSRFVDNGVFGVNNNCVGGGDVKLTGVNVSGNGNSSSLTPGEVVAGIFGAAGTRTMITSVAANGGNNNGVDVGAAIVADRGSGGLDGAYMEIDDYFMSGTAVGWVAFAIGDPAGAGVNAAPKMKIGKGVLPCKGSTNNQTGVLCWATGQADVVEMSLIAGPAGQVFAEGVTAFGAGSVARVGSNCDLEAATNPATSAIGIINIGLFNAAGGALTFPFPVRSTEIPDLVPITTGGTGAMPQVTKNLGVSVVFTPGPGDTGDWQFVIR